MRAARKVWHIWLQRQPGLQLVRSVVDLITAILKARSEGAKEGDQPDAPLELMICSVDDSREYREEIIFRIGHDQPVNQ